MGRGLASCRLWSEGQANGWGQGLRASFPPPPRPREAGPALGAASGWGWGLREGLGTDG